MPYFDEQKRYDEYRFDEPWDSKHNKTLIERMPAVYRHPNDADEASISGYSTVTGKDTMFPGKDDLAFRDVRDGLTNMLLVVEAKRKTPWTNADGEVVGEF